MVDGDKLGVIGFEKLGTPYSTMDCQAFVEWCLKQCGCNKDLPGSNAWYREVYHNGEVMTPEECVSKYGTVPIGAFLFILEFDGGEEKRGYHDGLGNASHIGLVTGQGEGAIHSSSSRGCVCESKFKNKTIPNGGWNRVGLWDQVEYGGVPTPGPSPEPQPTPPSPEPTPKPEPTPTYQTAIVWSENGKPVNTRKGPGKNYPLSKAGKLEVGTPVEVIDTDGEWSKIIVVDENNAKWYCWIMTQFLKFDDIPEPVPDPDDDPEPDPSPYTGLVTAHIAHLTLEEADSIIVNYEDAWMTPE